jgi:hypothetical protein
MSKSKKSEWLAMAETLARSIGARAAVGARQLKGLHVSKGLLALKWLCAAAGAVVVAAVLMASIGAALVLAGHGDYAPEDLVFAMRSNALGPSRMLRVVSCQVASVSSRDPNETFACAERADGSLYLVERVAWSRKVEESCHAGECRVMEPAGPILDGEYVLTCSKDEVCKLRAPAGKADGLAALPDAGVGENGKLSVLYGKKDGYDWVQAPRGHWSLGGWVALVSGRHGVDQDMSGLDLAWASYHGDAQGRSRSWVRAILGLAGGALRLRSLER